MDPHDSGRPVTRTCALIFDVFGTLVDWRGSIAAHLEGWSRRSGTVADWAALADAWRAAYPPAMDAVRRGERAWANVDVLHGEALDALLPSFGIAPLAAADRAWFVNLWHRLDPWPDVPAGLDRLRENFAMATLSNGHLGLQIDLGRHGGLRFDALFSAETFGHYKPDPETYLGAARLLGLTPGEVMLCASHPSDLRAAARCGLGTALIARPLEYGPRGGSLTPGAPESKDGFDLYAGDLGDLAGKLAAAGATGPFVAGSTAARAEGFGP